MLSCEVERGLVVEQDGFPRGKANLFQGRVLELLRGMGRFLPNLDRLDRLETFNEFRQGSWKFQGVRGLILLTKNL